jgi:hypothetical protein
METGKRPEKGEKDRKRDNVNYSSQAGEKVRHFRAASPFALRPAAEAFLPRQGPRALA